jgi:hypothetical protein
VALRRAEIELCSRTEDYRLGWMTSFYTGFVGVTRYRGGRSNTAAADYDEGARAGLTFRSSIGDDEPATHREFLRIRGASDSGGS